MEKYFSKKTIQELEKRKEQLVRRASIQTAEIISPWKEANEKIEGFPDLNIEVNSNNILTMAGNASENDPVFADALLINLNNADEKRFLNELNSKFNNLGNMYRKLVGIECVLGLPSRPQITKVIAEVKKNSKKKKIKEKFVNEVMKREYGITIRGAWQLLDELNISYERHTTIPKGTQSFEQIFKN